MSPLAWWWILQKKRRAVMSQAQRVNQSWRTPWPLSADDFNLILLVNTPFPSQRPQPSWAQPCGCTGSTQNTRAVSCSPVMDCTSSGLGELWLSWHGWELPLEKQNTGVLYPEIFLREEWVLLLKLTFSEDNQAAPFCWLHGHGNFPGKQRLEALF